MSTQADDVMQTPAGKQVREQVLAAKRAARPLASASAEMKNAALLRMADDIEARREVIQAENEKDLRAGRENGLTEALLDRLNLTDDRVATMADGLRQIAALPDPVGEVIGMSTRPQGLRVGRVRVPLGVIGIIYESRPNVTADAAALCMKAGNATVLRGDAAEDQVLCT